MPDRCHRSGMQEVPDYINFIETAKQRLAPIDLDWFYVRFAASTTTVRRVLVPSFESTVVASSLLPCTIWNISNRLRGIQRKAARKLTSQGRSIRTIARLVKLLPNTLLPLMFRSFKNAL